MSRPSVPHLTRRFVALAGLLILLGVMPSCSATKVVPIGKLVTAGCRIEAVDGSFSMRAGEQFDTPFSVDIRKKRWTKDEVVACHGEAKKLGAMPVRVTVQDGRRFHGLILFCRVPKKANGIAARMHQVEMKPEFVDMCHGGRNSVMYGTVDAPGVRIPPGMTPEQEQQLRNALMSRNGAPFSWILWISETEI